MKLKCNMRTTVTINDDLYRAVKAQAALEGQTVGSLIEDPLRLMIARSAAVAGQNSPPDLPRSEMGIRRGIDINDNSALQDALDEGLSADEVH